MNASPQRATRGAGLGRHRAKRALQRDLTDLLAAAGVPRPIPGDRVRATADVLMPTARRRDEGNYRTALEKALGDALGPPVQSAEERAYGIPPAEGYLPDDTPEHFTFGAVTFGLTDRAAYKPPGARVAPRLPAVCRIRLVWGDDLAAELERELEQLRGGALVDDGERQGDGDAVPRPDGDDERERPAA